MTGAYLRAQREGKWENIEVEHLTKEERLEKFKDRTPEELVRWLDLLCEGVVECERRLEGAAYCRAVDQEGAPGSLVIPAWLPAPKKRLAVILECGVVQGIVSDNPEALRDLEIVSIDYDTEGGDNEFFSNVRQPDGSYKTAYVHHQYPEKTEIGLDDFPEGHQCSGEDCQTFVTRDDPYYATPCGSFCESCMARHHAPECEICANEFGFAWEDEG